MKITEVKISNVTIGKKLLLIEIQPYYMYSNHVKLKQLKVLALIED